MSLKTIRVLWRMCFYTTNCNCSGNHQGLIIGLIGHNRVIVTTKVLLEWVTVIVTQCWVAAEFKVETRVLKSVCPCVFLAVQFYKDTEWDVKFVMSSTQFTGLWTAVDCLLCPLNHERLWNLTNCHTHSKSWQAVVLRSCQTLTMGPQVKTSSFNCIIWIQLHFCFVFEYYSISVTKLIQHWVTLEMTTRASPMDIYLPCT